MGVRGGREREREKERWSWKERDVKRNIGK